MHIIKVNEYRWTKWETHHRWGFYGKFDDLAADDVLDSDINQNNYNMEGGRQDVGQYSPQRILVVDPMINLATYSGKKNWISRQSYLCIWWLDIQ